MNNINKLWEEFLKDSREFHLNSFVTRGHFQPDVWDGDLLRTEISEKFRSLNEL